MNTTESYRIGPGLRVKLRQMVDAFDGAPASAGSPPVPVRLQEISTRGAFVRLGKTTAAWDKGALATITLYDQGEPPSEYAADPPNTLAGCVNKTQNVPANKFVILGRNPNGHWYLIDAECG